jgi:hypothetical protein
VDEHEQIQPLEEHRVHAEEVRRYQGLGMGREELLPVLRDRVAELKQLASNSQVAPPRVLRRQSDDEPAAFTGRPSSSPW